VRRHRDVPILEAVTGGTAVGALAGLLRGNPSATQIADVAWLAVFGTVTMGLGMALFTVGARRIPSAQAALVGALESPLAPLWVWLAFAEVPPTTTFIGGALILAALAWHLAGELRATKS
jgi:drug/metabolite transporter (DMT)-like permease